MRHYHVGHHVGHHVGRQLWSAALVGSFGRHRWQTVWSAALVGNFGRLLLSATLVGSFGRHHWQTVWSATLVGTIDYLLGRHPWPAPLVGTVDYLLGRHFWPAPLVGTVGHLLGYQFGRHRERAATDWKNTSSINLPARIHTKEKNGRIRTSLPSNIRDCRSRNIAVELYRLLPLHSLLTDGSMSLGQVWMVPSTACKRCRHGNVPE